VKLLFWTDGRTDFGVTLDGTPGPVRVPGPGPGPGPRALGPMCLENAGLERFTRFIVVPQ